MKLNNFHVDASMTEAVLLNRFKKNPLGKQLIQIGRQAVAHGNIKISGIELKDPDLNRLHDIVNEIDSRRVFYNCDDDETPKYAMDSLYEARDEIRDLSKGVWADQCCESYIKLISDSLETCCTKAECLNPYELNIGSQEGKQFMGIISDMRVAVWFCVAALQERVGSSIINPIHLPDKISERVKEMYTI
jgi:hypothetical protein